MAVGFGTVVDVAEAVRLSLAPAFLLSGAATMLNVMTGRLARIIDRGRSLTEGSSAPRMTPELREELMTLEHRRHSVSRAITAGTIAALLLCTVIVVLFIDVLISAALQWLVGGLFVASTLALVVGLAYFLREVHQATHLTRIKVPKVE